jgi:hypothetical protein
MLSRQKLALIIALALIAIGLCAEAVRRQGRVGPLTTRANDRTEKGARD